MVEAVADARHSVLVDHHVHIFSSEARQRLEGMIGRKLPRFEVEDLVGVLDRDRVDQAVVLSTGYLMGDDELRRRENDWVAEQVARHAGRLVAFLGVDPLVGAPEEIERCASSGNFAGVKVHLANSGVDLRSAAHRGLVARCFTAAREAGMPLVVHLRTSREFGALDAQYFVDEVLPAADGVAVQIAHMGGWGGYDEATQAALATLTASPFVRERAADVYFDLSAVVRGQPINRAHYDTLAHYVDAIGRDRILFGTDWPDWEPRSYLRDLETAGVRLGELTRAPWLGHT